VPPGWTIAIELMGSLLIPLFAVLLVRSHLTFLVLACLLLVGSFGFAGMLPANAGMYLVDFAVGAALVPMTDSLLLRSRGAGIAAIAALFGIILLRALVETTTRNPLVHLVELLLSAVIVGVTAARSGSNSFLASKPLVLLGDISYSLYLIHFVVLFVIGKMLVLFGLHLQGWSGATILGVLTLGISLPLAWLLFRYVEKPGIELGKWSIRVTQPFLRKPRGAVA
jgi:peptidoglycan/LPS O-acetylase OafA/YrhL